jgi:hypothetical protein
MIVLLLLLLSVIDISLARTTTGLQVCPPENGFVTVYEREQRSPLLGIYGGWLGWLDNVDRRDENVAPTHLYIIVLPTGSRSLDKLSVWENGRAISNKWMDFHTRPALHSRFPLVSDKYDFGATWNLHESSFNSTSLKAPQMYWLLWSALTEQQLVVWSKTQRLPVRFDDIVVRVQGEATLRSGLVEFELCGVAAPPQRYHSGGGATVGICIAPFSPFWLWSSTLTQYIAWYALHHGATIFLAGRPEDGEAMREFVRPFVAANLVTFEVVRWPELPSVWLEGSLPFSNPQSPWRRFQNGAVLHQCIAKYRDHFDWVLRIDFDEYLVIDGDDKSQPSSTTLRTLLAAMPRTAENVAFAMVVYRAQVNALAFNTTVFETFVRLIGSGMHGLLPPQIDHNWRFWNWKMAMRTNASLGYYTAHGACDADNRTTVVADPFRARLLHATIGDHPIRVDQRFVVDWSVHSNRLRQVLHELDWIVRGNARVNKM